MTETANGRVATGYVPRRITELHYSVINEDSIHRQSVLQCRRVIGREKDFGINDKRLGVCNKTDLCGTCGLNTEDCVGHAGHIDLALPVFHPGFFSMVIRIARSICKRCAHVLLAPEEKQFYARKFLSGKLDPLQISALTKTVAAEAYKTRICLNCSALNGTVRRLRPMRLVHEKYNKGILRRGETADDGQESFEAVVACAQGQNPEVTAALHHAQDFLDPLKLRDLFRAIPPHDVTLLGMRPGVSVSDLIMSTLVVPAVCSRPSGPAQTGTGTREDDLSLQYQDILLACDAMKDEKTGALDPVKLADQWDALQLRVSRLMDAALPGYPAALKPALVKSYAQRVKGKHGRFRGHLSGKRVNFSGRSVISPDPNLDIDELAIPLRVALKLTYAQVVFDGNIELMRKLVLNGPERHPGACFVIQKDGAKKNLHFDRDGVAARLAPGDVVERHCMNGDLLIFNRQPSLHRISMMCHRARVLPHRTLRFNVCCCAPYNADFDGDEMNIHLVQSDEARAEVKTLLSTRRNIITAKNGEPIIACTQDFLTASYLLTSKDIFMDRAQFTQFAAHWMRDGVTAELPMPTILRPKELWTGKQVFDVIIRPCGDVAVRGGKVIRSGTIGAAGAGGFPAAPPMAQNDDEDAVAGPDDGNTDASVVAGANVTSCSPTSLNFSVDGKRVSAQRQKQLVEMQEQFITFEAASKSYTRGRRHECPEEGYVAMTNSHLIAGRLDKKLLGGGAKDGLFAHLHAAGGGDYAAKVMARIGRGTSRWLMNYGFSLGLGDVSTSAVLKEQKEAIVDKYFAICDDLIAQAKAGKLQPVPGMTVAQTLEAKLNGELSEVRSQCGDAAVKILEVGNAPNTMALSGSKGSPLNIAQMMACVGQQTVSGKRIRNAFIQRTLPHFERMAEQPAARGFVRASFFSGLSMTEFFFHTMAGREGLIDTAVKTAETGYIYRRLMKAMEDLSVQYDGTVRNSKKDIVQLTYGEDSLDPVLMEGPNSTPIDFNALWMAIAHSTPVRPEEDVVLSPAQLAAEVHASLARPELATVCSKRFLSDLAEFWAKKSEQLQQLRGQHGVVDGAAELPIKTKTWLKQLLPVTRPRVQHFFTVCAKKYRTKQCEPGTACGAIAAQSVGEPSTQMTLRTFHFAGVASMSITQGVPRLVEVINANKNIATPVIRAPLETDSPIAALGVKARMERVLLKEIMTEVSEVISPGSSFLRFKLDRRLISRLHLPINAGTVKAAILKYARKPMSPMRHLTEAMVQIQGEECLAVTPCDDGKGGKLTPHRRTLFNLKRLMQMILDIPVSGITAVKRAIVTKSKSGAREVLAEGDAFRSVMGLPGVDGTKTMCNHVAPVEAVLGIEAARTVIVSEIRGIMNAYGLSIDLRHVYLLADVMTHRGLVLGITRYGIQKMNSGVLTMASFERTTEHLYDAAVHQRADETLSVSESIIVGAPVPLGTNAFGLMLDRRIDSVSQICGSVCATAPTPPAATGEAVSDKNKASGNGNGATASASQPPVKSAVVDEDAAAAVEFTSGVEAPFSPFTPFSTTPPPAPVPNGKGGKGKKAPQWITNNFNFVSASQQQSAGGDATGRFRTVFGRGASAGLGASDFMVGLAR